MLNSSHPIFRFTLSLLLFSQALSILLGKVFAEDRSAIQIDPDPPSSTFSPEESLSKIRVPVGFRLELVAAEPMIEEPVCMAWGPNGELYVAEMRSYMQDIDMSGELEPISRVVKLVDLDGDGRMDKATTYLDNLVLPRAILTLDNKVLIGDSGVGVPRFRVELGIGNSCGGGSPMNMKIGQLFEIELGEVSFGVLENITFCLKGSGSKPGRLIVLQGVGPGKVIKPGLRAYISEHCSPVDITGFTRSVDIV